MPYTVRVRNFQSIRDATLRVDGFTVVTGANNTGKTACLRAIRSAFTNARGHAFVRHGEPKCQVDITFDDGRTLSWEKGEKVKPRYVVDGREIFPGAGVPDEVAALGVLAIQAGDRELWPQIAQQFTGQVFLLDLPGSVLAEVVADVERVGQLSSALRASESDRRASTSELKLRRVDLEKQEIEVRRFDGLDEAVDAVAGLEATAAALHVEQGKVRGLQALLARLVAARGVESALRGADSIAVPGDEGAIAARQDLARIEKAGGLVTRLASARGVVSALNGVDNVMVPDLPEQVGKDLAEARDLRALQGRLSKASNLVARLSGTTAIIIPVLDPTLAKITATTADLGALSNRLASAATSVAADTVKLAGLESELADAEREVREALLDLPACPTCGQATEHEHRG